MSARPLNAHGDLLLPTTGAHGADIAAQRLDELDRIALQWLLARGGQRSVGVEFGGGGGWQALRFALLGAEVQGYDLIAPAPAVTAAAAGLRYRTTQLDLATLRAPQLPRRIDFVYSQRMLHYLRHADARRLLALAARRLGADGRCFVSVSGLHSELGRGYAGAEAPLARRFAPLAAELACKHGIAVPVCLYGEAEFAALLSSAGLQPLRLWRSPFGNLKSVCEPAV